MKLAILALHPVQYQDKIWKLLNLKAKFYNIKVNVLFLDNIGLKKFLVKDFNTSIDFKDILSLSYPHKFLKNISPFKLHPFLGRMNPSLIFEIPKYDVILIHGYTHISMQMALIVAKFLRKKVIFRGEAVPFVVDSLKGRLKKIYLANFFRLIDIALYSCSGNKKFLEMCGVPEEKMIFIPCAVDNEFFRREFLKYREKRKMIRKKLGIEENEIVISTVARLVEIKRPYDLIRAIAIIKKQHPDFKIKMLFVGDGPLRESLINLAKSLSLNKDLIITGFKKQSEIGKFYTISDIFVLPSSKDPSPKALNEALNFELPAIITDVCGTAGDLVKHGYNGYIIKVGDVEKLAEYIYDLAINKEKRKLFGKRGWEIVKDWNFEKDAEAIIEAVKRVFGKNVLI